MTGKTKVVLCVMAVFAAAMLLLSITSCGNTRTNIVDGKAVLTECPPGPVYLLEIDSEDEFQSSEEEGAESYVCVTKKEYDVNQVSQQWRSANGSLK